MYDYEKFYKENSVDVHDDPERHSKIAELCIGVVADIGCGTGTLSDYYSGLYHGYDLAHSAIEKAKKVRRDTAIFSQFDVANIADFSFIAVDTIVMSEFLEHISDDSQLFSKIKKDASVGTRLVISVPNGDRVPCDEHVREFTVPELRKKLEPLGRVRFYNWPGAEKRIICTCDIGVAPVKDLALVMIAKNEEKGLEKAILSCIDFVDEIVVAIDQKSQDKTSDIARRYADEVRYFIWEDDFSKARNYAHGDVKSKWILSLDGHEYVDNHDNLSEKLKLETDGLLCTIEEPNGFCHEYPRIYKNGIQFVGSVHNKINCKSVKPFLNFHINHNREDLQDKESAKIRKSQRDKMVPRIMGKQYKEDKKNIRATFHLAMHYLGNQKPFPAFRWCRRYLKYSTCKGERWFVYFCMAQSLFSRGKLLRSLYYLNLADAEQPGRWEIYKLKGFISFARKRYFEAAEYFVKSFCDNNFHTDYKPFPRRVSETWNAIGECFFNLGNYAKAYHSFASASREATDEMAKKFLNDRAELMKKLTENS